MDPEFDELKREFLAEARLKVLDIREAISSGTPQSLERVSYLAHQLKGSGGSYGYQTISQEAAELERVIEKLAGSETAPVDQLDKHAQNLGAEIDARSRELEIKPAV